MFSKLSQPPQISEPASSPPAGRRRRSTLTRKNGFLNKKYKPFVLLLNGAPGTGKATVAKELHAALTNSVFLDNHTLIDTVEVITSRGASNYAKGRKLFLDAAVKTMTEDPDTTKQFIITSVLASNKAFTLEQYLKVAKARRLHFIVANLNISEEENKRRVSSEERRASKTGKATNPEFIVDWRKSHTLLEPEKVNAFRKYGGKLIELDVSTKSPEETANEILTIIGNMKVKV